jgi:hypothetical protein
MTNLELLSVLRQDDFVIAHNNHLPMNLLGKSLFTAKKDFNATTSANYRVIKSKIPGVCPNEIFDYETVKMIFDRVAKEAKKNKLKALVAQ